MADPSTAAAPAAGGLPQFDMAQWPGQMVWALLIFVSLYLLFRFVFVPRVGGTIDAREDKIAGDIGDARRARDAALADSAAAADELAQARARAHKLASDAKAQAKATSLARQAEEDARLSAGLAEAEARIAAARGEAMSHVRAIAIETAQAMIEKLTGQPAEAGEIERGLAGQA